MAKTTKKPVRKTDAELFNLIEKKIAKVEYIFKPHAKQRLKERRISDIVVLDILEGKVKNKRIRNKGKDTYQSGRPDWNYCIEGQNTDGKKIRVIVSFEKNLLPIITVMWI